MEEEEDGGAEAPQSSGESGWEDEDVLPARRSFRCSAAGAAWLGLFSSDVAVQLGRGWVGSLHRLVGTPITAAEPRCARSRRNARQRQDEEDEEGDRTGRAARQRGGQPNYREEDSDEEEEEQASEEAEEEESGDESDGDGGHAVRSRRQHAAARPTYCESSSDEEGSKDGSEEEQPRKQQAVALPRATRPRHAPTHKGRRSLRERQRVCYNEDALLAVGGPGLHGGRHTGSKRLLALLNVEGFEAAAVREAHRTVCGLAAAGGQRRGEQRGGGGGEWQRRERRRAAAGTAHPACGQGRRPCHPQAGRRRQAAQERAPCRRARCATAVRARQPAAVAGPARPLLSCPAPCCCSQVPCGRQLGRGQRLGQQLQ